jgi:hypothetical protein
MKFIYYFGITIYAVSFFLPCVSGMRGYDCAVEVLRLLTSGQGVAAYLIGIFLNLANFLTLTVFLLQFRYRTLTIWLLQVLATLSASYWVAITLGGGAFGFEQLRDIPIAYWCWWSGMLIATVALIPRRHGRRVSTTLHHNP